MLVRPARREFAGKLGDGRLFGLGVTPDRRIGCHQLTIQYQLETNVAKATAPLISAQA